MNEARASTTAMPTAAAAGRRRPADACLAMPLRGGRPAWPGAVLGPVAAVYMLMNTYESDGPFFGYIAIL